MRTTPLSGESLQHGAGLGLTSPGWALVYWDDFALVYLKRSPRWDAVIARDEYVLVHPANGLPDFWRSLGDKAALARILAELQRNVAETGSARGLTLLGFALLQEGSRRGASASLLCAIRAAVSTFYRARALGWHRRAKGARLEGTSAT